MTIIRTTTALTAALLAALALAACASLPIPADIDLRARMGEATSGSVQVPVEPTEPGEAEDLTMTLPDAGGQCVDIPAEAVAVTVQSAQIHWNVDVTYDGPDLSGRLQARLFVAGPGAELFHPSHTVGPTVNVNLDRTTTRFAGTAVLGPQALAALNDRRICWGVRLVGDDVVVQEAGTATITYDVRDLWVRVRFSVI
jgi:hypothetical protein